MSATDRPSVEVQLAVINTKLDLLIEQRSDHELRIRALEQFRWRLAGLASAAGALAGAVATFLVR